MGDTDFRLVAHLASVRDYLASLPMPIGARDELRHFRFWKSVRTELLASFLFVLLTSSARLTCFRVFHSSSSSSIDCHLSPTSVSSTLPIGIDKSITNDVSSVGVASVASGAVDALTVATLTQVFGATSGAHLVPSVTLALAVGGHLTHLRLFAYLTVQMVAALTGVALVASLTPNNNNNNNSNNSECRHSLERRSPDDVPSHRRPMSAIDEKLSRSTTNYGAQQNRIHIEHALRSPAVKNVDDNQLNETETETTTMSPQWPAIKIESRAVRYVGSGAPVVEQRRANDYHQHRQQIVDVAVRRPSDLGQLKWLLPRVMLATRRPYSANESAVNRNHSSNKNNNDDDDGDQENEDDDDDYQWSHAIDTVTGERVGVANVIVFQTAAHAVLALAYLANADPARTDLGFKSLSVGVAYFVGHVFAWPSGGFVDSPFKLMAASLALRAWCSFWIVYLVTALVGAFFAGLTYEYVESSKRPHTALTRSFLTNDQNTNNNNHNNDNDNHKRRYQMDQQKNLRSFASRRQVADSSFGLPVIECIELQAKRHHERDLVDDCDVSSAHVSPTHSSIASTSTSAAPVTMASSQSPLGPGANKVSPRRVDSVSEKNNPRITSSYDPNFTLASSTKIDFNNNNNNNNSTTIEVVNY